MSNALIGKCAPLLLVAIGAWTYAIFAAACGCMLIFAFLCVPETAGLTLEEISARLQGGAGGAAAGARCCTAAALSRGSAEETQRLHLPSQLKQPAGDEG